MRLKPGRPDLERHRARFAVPPAEGEIAVTWLGVATLLLDDGRTAVMSDGFFSRPSLLAVATRRLRPHEDRIDAALHDVRLGDGRRTLAAVFPVHTHFDHAMDSAAVALRTGARLVGGRSAAHVGRGGGLPDDRIDVVGDGDVATYGDWSLTFVASDHCPPDRYPGEITAPVVPPARAGDYRCGQAWSVLVEHAGGRTALVQGSAGFVPGALAGRRADVAYLGVGQLGLQPEAYLRDYWHETVETVGARRVVLVHWDDFFRPLDRPLRALPYAGDDLDHTLSVLGPLAASQGVSLLLPTLGRREDPWA